MVYVTSTIHFPRKGKGVSWRDLWAGRGLCGAARTVGAPRTDAPATAAASYPSRVAQGRVRMRRSHRAPIPGAARPTRRRQPGLPAELPARAREALRHIFCVHIRQSDRSHSPSQPTQSEQASIFLSLLCAHECPKNLQVAESTLNRAHADIDI